MNKTTILYLTIIIASALSVTYGSDAPAYVETTSIYVPNEIIVKFKKSVAYIVGNGISEGRQVGDLKLSDSLDELHKKYRLQDARALFRDFRKKRRQVRGLLRKDEALLTKREKRILRRLKRVPKGAKVPDLDRIYKIEVDLEPNQPLEEIVAAYNSDPDVEYAELNYIVTADLVSNEPYYPIQWSLNNIGQMYPESGDYNPPPGTPNCDIDAPEAWDITTGSSDIIVAVVDTGAYYIHRDLDDNMWINQAELNGTAGFDDDGNGRIDDIYGYDFVNNDSDPVDDDGHGTHVSGIIAAEGNNWRDITGVNWDAQIMALKFLDSSGSGHSSDAVIAFYYAVDNGADIVSNSWGGSNYLQAMQDAIDYAYSQGVIMVAAAGNDNYISPHYPAYYDHVISVAATNSNDERASFSNYGDWVDIAAPGVDVLSLRAAGTSAGTAYNHFTAIISGTSMACPHVAGVVGLLLAQYPDISLDELTARLLATADDISAQNPGYDSLLGSGRLNAYKALRNGFEGLITFDRDLYSCDDIVSIELVDFDLIGQTSQDVILTSSGGDEEVVTLIRDVNNPWMFTDTICISANSVTVGDGVLEVSNGQIITAGYYDDDNGEGSPATAEAIATIDCQGPVIFNVQTKTVTSSGAMVTFETNEPATGYIRCGLTSGGPYPIIGQDLTLANTHTVYLSGLASQTKYYFVVDANDTVGNTSTDDNNALCYSFTTTTTPVGLHVPGAYSTIQAAIDTAVDGETIWVADGTYTGAGNRDIDFKGKAITVANENGPQNCIIDCQQQGRGFYFHSGEDVNSILRGLTITNGYIERHDSWGVGGAGILCLDASFTITNCIITENRTASAGGGIYCSGSLGSNAVIRDCIISDNSADMTGGIYCGRGNQTISDCVISDNIGTNDGAGGITFWQDSAAVMRNCIIKNNIAKHNSRGGGIRCSGSNSPIIENCIITGNRTVGQNYGGSGIYTNGSNSTITNCTFSRNSAGGKGGGAWFRVNKNITVTNCIFRDNYPREIYKEDMGYRELTVTYSNVKGGWEGEGNIDADPCFVDGYNGDYHLLEESPCINAGDPSYVPEPDETDFDGNPRVLDGRIDIGAYECNIDMPPIADAGPNQITYADHTGQAHVTLDGSASYDLDGDQLTYYWNWIIDANIYEANGVNPTIDLPAGQYSIELIVNDGIVDSKPNYTTVTVMQINQTPIADAGSIVAWGRNSSGQATPPEGNDFVAIAAGSFHDLALRSDGSIVGWGDNNHDQATPPQGDGFVAIAAGRHHSLALKSDSSIVGWGSNYEGQAITPDGNDFAALSAGYVHSLALKFDGSIIAWGNNQYGQTELPYGHGNDFFVAIAAGSFHNLALRYNGSIVGWGHNGYGQATAPDGNDFIALNAGGRHSLALKSDGSIIAWGRNDFGQIDAPDGNDFIAISAGFGHSLALKSDGSIVGWGWNRDGQIDVPDGNDFVAIAANIAIRTNTSPIADAGPNQIAYADHTGQAQVTLDGSVSYDADGDELSYYWNWLIDGDVCDTNGINPTIELPVGEHLIELIVNDGTEDSEPNYTTVTVIEPLQADLTIYPTSIVRHNRAKRITATIHLPRGITKDEIDSDTKLILYPGGIEAKSRVISQRRRRPVTISAYFDKAELMNAIENNGRVELQVIGRLKTGQYFYGENSVTIRTRRSLQN